MFHTQLNSSEQEVPVLVEQILRNNAPSHVVNHVYTMCAGRIRRTDCGQDRF